MFQKLKIWKIRQLTHLYLSSKIPKPNNTISRAHQHRHVTTCVRTYAYTHSDTHTNKHQNIKYSSTLLLIEPCKIHIVLIFLWMSLTCRSAKLKCIDSNRMQDGKTEIMRFRWLHWKALAIHSWFIRCRFIMNDLMSEYYHHVNRYVN